jgi:SOS-response transcriptional repressor LexA
MNHSAVPDIRFPSQDAQAALRTTPPETGGGGVRVSSEDGEARARELGLKLTEHRRRIGLNRPAFVREMRRHGVEITPDYLGKLEYGTRSLAATSPEVREAIRAVLSLSHERWRAEFGLYTAPSILPTLNEVMSNRPAGASDQGGSVPGDTLLARPWIEVPVYSFASASLIVTTPEEPTVIATRPVAPEHVNRGKALFRVVGRSMEPTISEGWDIVVDTANVRLDENAVILLAVPNGDVAVKRVRTVSGEKWLYCDNPDPAYYPRPIEDGMVVRGRVLGAYPPYVRLT